MNLRERELTAKDDCPVAMRWHGLFVDASCLRPIYTCCFFSLAKANHSLGCSPGVCTTDAGNRLIHLVLASASMSRKRTFFDVSVDGNPAGRYVSLMSRSKFLSLT